MEPQIIELDGNRLVKVRIGIVVDSSGSWIVNGFSRHTRQQTIDEVSGVADGLGFEPTRHLRFIYALVPVPDEIDDLIEGEVKNS